jgi:hypothetical protein
VQLGMFLCFLLENSNPVAFRPNVHCNGNPIYVFPKKDLCGFSPNFHSYVSVSELYIPRIGPHIFLQQNRQTYRGNNIEIAHRHKNETNTHIFRTEFVSLFFDVRFSDFDLYLHEK